MPDIEKVPLQGPARRSSVPAGSVWRFFCNVEEYLSEEIKEFESEYADKTWKDYQEDKKLQKLMDRTVENILTALIEICGTTLVEECIGVDSYSGALKKSAKLLGFSEREQDNLSRLAIQRNRLAHRYLNFRWQAIKMFNEQKHLIIEFVTKILEREKKESRVRTNI